MNILALSSRVGTELQHFHQTHRIQNSSNSSTEPNCAIVPSLFLLQFDSIAEHAFIFDTSGFMTGTPALNVLESLISQFPIAEHFTRPLLKYVTCVPPLFAVTNAIDPRLLRQTHRKLLASVAVYPSADTAAAFVELTGQRPMVFGKHFNAFLWQ
jgi:hypothetical protein